MASLYRQSSGRWELQFKGPDRKRRTIRLGLMDESTAKQIGRHVDHLVECCVCDKPPTRATDRWVSVILTESCWHWLYDRLASANLVAERTETAKPHSAHTLATVLNDYIDKRRDVKPSTKLLYAQTRKNLLDYFSEGTRIAKITVGHAKDWRLWLLNEAHELKKKRARKAGHPETGHECGLAKSTVNRRVRCAKQFFEDAVDHAIIPTNPFRKIKGGQSVNRSRMYFVSRDTVKRVLDSCPDAEWRAIVALARYAGIRIPSELHPLKWEDVNFEQGTLMVTSPKTEHCDKPYRILPLEVFCDLRPYLEDLLEIAQSQGGGKSTDFVITRYRHRNTNLRTQFIRILKRTGVTPWPKLFQNCRSSCETELIYFGHLLHEVCAWIGNSPQVANAHYLQILDSSQKTDLERSTAESRGAKVPRGDAKCDAKSDAATGTEVTASNCTSSEETRENPVKTTIFPGFDGVSEYARQDSNL